jgi:hypothetical protein
LPLGLTRFLEIERGGFTPVFRSLTLAGPNKNTAGRVRLVTGRGDGYVAKCDFGAAIASLSEALPSGLPLRPL